MSSHVRPTLQHVHESPTGLVVPPKGLPKPTATDTHVRLDELLSCVLDCMKRFTCH